MEDDSILREGFFRNLAMLFYMYDCYMYIQYLYIFGNRADTFRFGIRIRYFTYFGI